MANEAIQAIEAKMSAPKPDLQAAHEQTRQEAVATHSETVVESEPAAPANTPAENVSEETVASDGTDTPARQNKGVGKRINELTKEKHDERRAREAAERRIAELEAQLSKPAQTQTPSQAPTQAPTELGAEPRLEDFDFDDLAHKRALFKYWRDQERLEEQQQARQAQIQTRLKTYQERADAFADDNPDYMEVVSSMKVTPAMEEAIFETEMEPQIAYYLAKNPAELERIAQLSPAGQVRAIGKLEDKLSAPPAVEEEAPEAPATPSRPPSVPSPPPPPPSVQGKSTAKAPVAQWDLNQHIEAVRAKSTRR